MARYRGTLRGQRKSIPASRLGHAETGLEVEAQSWQGKVHVELYALGDLDYAIITLAQHDGEGVFPTVVVYHGPVNPSMQTLATQLRNAAQLAEAR